MSQAAGEGARAAPDAPAWALERQRWLRKNAAWMRSTTAVRSTKSMAISGTTEGTEGDGGHGATEASRSGCQRRGFTGMGIQLATGWRLGAYRAPMVDINS